MTLGLFGGVFDPPHAGHVALVAAAKAALGLERVVVVVAAEPGHKRVQTPAGIRLELARAAFPDDEVVLDDHSRTVDMLRAHPEWHDATFLIGADELESFGSWKAPEEVLRLVRLGVAMRPGHEVDLADPERMTCFELEEPVSSSTLRERLERGEDASDVIPAAVWGMIERQGLYGRRPELHSNRLTSLEQARRIAALAQDKLARDVVIMDMQPVCSYTDYFVVATGNNPRQTKAIWDEVHAVLKRDQELLPRSVAGEAEATWIVADYLDVVLHVFTPEARGFYRLDDLWGDVPHEVVEAASA